jgi:hypothetical protein
MNTVINPPFVSSTQQARGLVFAKALAMMSKDSEIQYNSDWANGTGYFDHAVKGEHAPVLKLGQMVKCTDNNSRNILIIGCGGLGNFVMFDRYSNDDKGRIVFNCTLEVTKMFSGLLDNLLTADQIEFIYGTPITPNIGHRLEAMKKELVNL